MHSDERGKIRFVSIIGQLRAGGLERQLFELLGAIDRDRFEPSVVTFADGGRFFQPIADLDVPLTSLARRGLERTRRLVGILRERQPRLVYAWGTAAMAYGRMAARVRGIRAVTHDGSTAGLPVELRARLANLALLPATAAFTCNSHRRGSELRSLLPVHRSRVVVIPNGVRLPERGVCPEESARLRAELRLPEGPIVGCVARLDGLKNQAAILDAVGILRARQIRASVVLVGGGPMRRDLEDHAARLGLSDRVRLVGETSDVGSYLRGLSAFAFPSLLEGMPNAVQEALAHGVPCVASDVGDIRRLLDDGRAGIVMRPGDVDDLATGLERVLRDPDLARSLGNHGRRHMGEHYSVTTMVRQTESVFLRVLRGGLHPFSPLAPMDGGTAEA